MNHPYEYNFDQIDDYSEFERNCYLDCPEIVLKPIVNQYHENPSQLSIIKGEGGKICPQSAEEIIVSGRIFNHEVTVTYQPNAIRLVFNHQQFSLRYGKYLATDKWKYVDTLDQNQNIIGFHPWIYHQGKIPDHLPPEQGDPDATIVISLQIPEITQYCWDLWHDQLSPFNSVMDQFTNYIRAFYIDLDRYLPDPRLKIPDQTIQCTEIIIDQINDYAENANGRVFDPLTAHLMLTAACVRWKVYLYVRQYNQCLITIPYLPSIGIHYFQTENEYTHLSQV